MSDSARGVVCAPERRTLLVMVFALLSKRSTIRRDLEAGPGWPPSTPRFGAGPQGPHRRDRREPAARLGVACDSKHAATAARRSRRPRVLRIEANSYPDWLG